MSRENGSASIPLAEYEKMKDAAEATAKKVGELAEERAKLAVEAAKDACKTAIEATVMAMERLQEDNRSLRERLLKYEPADAGEKPGYAELEEDAKWWKKKWEEENAAWNLEKDRFWKASHRSFLERLFNTRTWEG